MGSSRYCTQCGAALAPGSRFCSQCGRPTEMPEETPSAPKPPSSSSPPPPPPPTRQVPPPAPARASTGSSVQAQEPILGVVTVGRSTGFMGLRQESYNMIVTPDRLVFAYVSPQLMKETVKEARQLAKQEGKGFFGQWGAQLGWTRVLQDRYRSMGVDAVMSHYEGSFVIPAHHIQRVRYKSNYDDESGQTSDELVLRTAGDKLRFKLVSGNLREVKGLLREALGGVA